MLRHLASIGKTVFVSSHLLAEIQQMADIVGIIAAGKLVREGSMRELLAAEGNIRVRIAPGEVATAIEILARVTDPAHVSVMADEPGWVSVQTAPARSTEINRALAESGIYASELTSGNDLEDLFLTLTDTGAADPDGTFAKPVRPAGTDKPGPTAS